MRNIVRRMLLIAGAGLVFLSSPAHADAIDGEWCNARGQKLSIDGPSLITPYGTRMEGDYDRHGFRYVAPANDPDAGHKIIMSLFSDDDMQLVRNNGTPESWRRCRLPTS